MDPYDDPLKGLGDEPQPLVTLEQLIAPVVPLPELRRGYLRASREYAEALASRKPMFELLGLEVARLEARLRLEISENTHPEERVGMIMQLLEIGSGTALADLLTRDLWGVQSDLDRARARPELHNQLVIRYIEARVRLLELKLQGLYLKLLKRDTTMIDKEVSAARAAVQAVVEHHERQRHGNGR